jgi:hypothetical protein
MPFFFGLDMVGDGGRVLCANLESRNNKNALLDSLSTVNVRMWVIGLVV